MRQDDSGPIDLLDHLGHGERFARASDAEKDLVAVSVIYAANEIGNGFGLVAARLVVTGNFEVHLRTLSCEKWVKLKTTIIPKVANRCLGADRCHDNGARAAISALFSGPFQDLGSVEGGSAGKSEIS